MEKQQKARSAKKLNFMSLEPETPLTLTSLEHFHNYDNAQILIKQTRRYNYIVYLPVFLNTAKRALKEGNYTIRENPLRICTPDYIMRANKSTPYKTHHSGPYSILITMDLVYGPSQSNVVKEQIDICGARISVHGDLAMKADPEVMIWLERAVQLHKNTHYICVTADCYVTFDKSLIYGFPFVCPECHVTQCPRCKTEWEPHEKLTCEEFHIKTTFGGLNDPYIKKQLYDGDIQPCPKCHTFTYKISGCNKIICEARHCSDYWCWGCGQGDLRAKNKDPYDHWFKKECPVCMGLFAEDATSAQIIKNAIRTRNLNTFGNQILQ